MSRRMVRATVCASSQSVMRLYDSGKRLRLLD